MFKIPKKLWQRTLMFLAAIIILIAGYQLRVWQEQNIKYNVVSVNSSDEVTSAITDRWELQITDRKTGRVRIYNQDILDAIFYQYQARRSYTQEDRKP